MSAMSEFLVATASQNNFGALSSQTLIAISSSIPIMTYMEDFSGAEEKAKNMR